MTNIVTPEQLRRMLPSAMMDLHDLLGDDGFLALVEAYGGTQLYVPSYVMPAAPLVQQLGIVAATSLSERYGSDRIDVSLCKRWRICLLRHRGLSRNVIARRVGGSVRTIDREMKRDRKSEKSFGPARPSSSQLGFKFDEPAG